MVDEEGDKSHTKAGMTMRREFNGLICFLEDDQVVLPCAAHSHDCPANIECGTYRCGNGDGRDFDFSFVIFSHPMLHPQSILIATGGP